MFIPTTAQQFDTKINSHIASLLHASTFFARRQGGIRQRRRKTTLANLGEYNGKCAVVINIVKSSYCRGHG
jgi:hypothetical protein